ncbi:PilZ domain-containing protein [Parvularcula sp. LCG005]|uniref:PilZ domain-containing protein n=1 Tax=Parvularcula sp. LCG005 TaxID=3078805 RepID=UPI002942038A|nr:PilZ domain-containing protein [Parvularcula sp. LCG005]WOI54159.1 PilZ domain-containing protein [Parvularcula sp. LCG005]
MAYRKVEHTGDTAVSRKAITGESRRHRRAPISLDAYLRYGDGTESAGTVSDISAGGVFIVTSGNTILDDEVALDIENVGPVNGRVVRITNEGIGVQFQHNRSMATKLADRLIALLNHAVLGRERRQSDRNVANNSVILTLGNERQISCRMTDISGGGAFIITTSRPLVGTQVQVGQKTATVIRHSDDGIGVVFATNRETEQ